MKKSHYRILSTIAVMLFSILAFSQDNQQVANNTTQTVVLKHGAKNVGAIPEGLKNKKSILYQNKHTVYKRAKNFPYTGKGMFYSVAKKPLYEEFTSSTCSPCAAANPILAAVLEANPGEYSLIKYQMDWPGSGDPYYTEEGGIRKEYYDVFGVPDLYINSNGMYPGDMTQAIFDSYLSEITDMELGIVASIDENYIITVDATVSPLANYDAGIKLHIVVVEKTTVGNVASNGETEFDNVMMKMLPDAEGTTLGALTNGVPVVVTESYDMGLTFMEQPDDLAVIVFTQDDEDKTVYQSEMIDVEGTFAAYDVTFVVDDSDGNLVGGAAIFLEGNGSATTGANGEATYEGVFPGSYEYTVEKPGLEGGSGSVVVVDQEITEYVTLNIPDYYFYEDFELELPNTWTTYSSGWNSVYWYGGKVIFFRQDPGSANLMLVSSEIDLSDAGTLILTIGDANNNPMIAVGTVDDPSNPDSFVELATFIALDEYQDYEVELSTYTGDDSYIAIKLISEEYGFFSLELFKITWGTIPLYPPTNLTAEAVASDVDLNWDAPASKALLGYNVYRDGELIAYVTETTYSDLDLEDGLYEYYVRAVYDEGQSPPSNVVQVIVGDVLIYCDAEGGCDEYIDGVVFGDINNMGTACTNYGDYTSMSTVVYPDSTYTLEWTTGNFYAADDYGIWIDWNQNGDFTDAGENVVCEFSIGAEVNTFDIIVPADAVPGDTRMRLRLKWSGDDCGQPCGTSLYGEVEDYTLIISGEAGPCENFDALTVGGLVAGQLGGQWTTWSGTSADDATVNNTYSNSPDNSFIVDAGTVDLILRLDDEPITTGQHLYSHYIYVPSGFSGYFNVQSEPEPGVAWVVDVFFDDGGTGSIDAQGSNTTFDYVQDAWILVEINFDLDAGLAEVYIDGTELLQFANALTIGGIDYYGYDAGGAPGAFYDDVCFGEGWAIEPLMPPTDLVATPVGMDVVLNWAAPSGGGDAIEELVCDNGKKSTDGQSGKAKGLLGYNVYYKFNSGSFNMVDFVEETTYTHEGVLVAGLHTYSVTALYDEGESGPSNVVSELISNIAANKTLGIIISPNPASDFVNITSEFIINSILIYNSSGDLIGNDKLNTKTLHINTSTYSPGLYYFKIESRNGIRYKKVIIE